MVTLFNKVRIMTLAVSVLKKKKNSGGFLISNHCANLVFNKWIAV